MDRSSRIITLTTDFGTSDVYVGVMKGVILSINPDVKIIDITHSVSPQDIYEAAFTIRAAYRYFPENTIHVVVVDPGVGSDRQPIVCQTDKAYFVCANNGVLSRVWQDIETDDTNTPKSVVIENPSYILPQVSNTFHGRDIFSPVAAHLSLGVALSQFGTPIQDLVRFPVSTVQTIDNSLTGQIIKIDSFGNLITNISEDMLTSFLLASGSNADSVDFEIRAGDTSLTKLNSFYAESEPSEPLAIIGSFGLLEIAINLGNAETGLGLKRDDRIVVRRFD
ncbi:SAM-dependent chlorinase/fluorinase [Candidatus Poribacteria bacterium]|nr:SAM-dependent chlorinase/fluorinase [Candidatus Poribacteria bacterium]MYB63599.1 SAM-dependent chlorinase/fluorinase [Candidatus Poribacteria bacterium]MYF54226.1 SAM-dependent chlorinase/fluorinase [Candidatus Poribacteria bacterium]MYI92777.1 SAM-dependent chlorinase/fluorinase [Candidatus Poribacteria bacterium]